MPPLTNTRQETFAQIMAAGSSQIEAHEAAGYKPQYSNASRLMRNDKVEQRITELQHYNCDLAQITVASLVARADEVR